MYRQRFIDAQSVFDKTYRQEERRYRFDQLNNLEKTVTSDPKQFWDTLKTLGPRKKCDITMEVYNGNGVIVNDTGVVLEKWRDEYNMLYNVQTEPGTFDDEFYNSCKNDIPNLEMHESTLDGLNDSISITEVSRALRDAKIKKSVGIDNLPNEILKNHKTMQMLHVLFQEIFETGITPSIWKTAIIKPLPKSSMTDPRLPLQYRGISLLSTLYKLFSSIMNSRITKCAEQHSIFADEQNGFRKNRSCLDHCYSLTSIIRNRKQQGKSTYVAFIDMEKAFDRVDRELLYYKLLKLGIRGKIYHCIKSMYSGSNARINLNGYLTECFPTEFGVKQGDCLSPTLFGLFINDLVDDIKHNTCGVNVSHFYVHCLLYADDIAFLAETEDDLQKMLDVLNNWCRKWRMKVNSKKSNVVHFRPKSCQMTDYSFTYDTETIEIVTKYKYLGLIFDEFLDYNATAAVLADSAGRALGAIYNKYKVNKGFGYETYTKLYESGVVPILDYCSGVWGYNFLEKIDAVQNRAIRLFLGVHKFAPNAAINADMGWVSCRTRRHVNMLHLWNRLVSMDDSRLTKAIFLWDKTKSGWCKNIKEILYNINCSEYFDNTAVIDLGVAKKLLHLVHCDNWRADVHNYPKLRTYVTFKHDYAVESYVKKIHNRGYRSALAQFRCGILPLSIETGRFKCIPLEYRLCNFCDQNVLENEEHFLFHCNFYCDERQKLFMSAVSAVEQFRHLNISEQMQILKSSDVSKSTAEYIYNAFQKRRKALYK